MMIDILSTRENEMVSELTKGYTVKEIAVRNCISPHTVDTHLKKCKRKTGARTLSHLAAIFVKNAIVALFLGIQILICVDQNDIDIRRPSRTRIKTSKVLRRRGD